MRKEPFPLFSLAAFIRLPCCGRPNQLFARVRTEWNFTFVLTFHFILSYGHVVLQARSIVHDYDFIFFSGQWTMRDHYVQLQMAAAFYRRMPMVISLRLRVSVPWLRSHFSRVNGMMR